MRACVAAIVLIAEISFGHALGAQRIIQPDEIAGRWETSDSKDINVGINILISATVPGATSKLIGIPQSWKDLEIGIYQRSHSNVETLGFNFFTTLLSGGASWDGSRLRIDTGPKAGLPEVHIDLEWNTTAHTWTGIFQRADYRNQAITLRRPQSSQNDPFVGTWFDESAVMNNCLHIYKAQDGTLTGWSDDIQIPRRIHYANGLRPPDRAIEHYGEIAKVNATVPDRIDVELRAYTPGCCSHRFTAAMSEDGTSLDAVWSARSNQAPRTARWKRVQGSSCAAAASHR